MATANFHRMAVALRLVATAVVAVLLLMLCAERAQMTKGLPIPRMDLAICIVLAATAALICKLLWRAAVSPLVAGVVAGLFLSPLDGLMGVLMGVLVGSLIVLPPIPARRYSLSAMLFVVALVAVASAVVVRYDLLGMRQEDPFREWDELTNRMVVTNAEYPSEVRGEPPFNKPPDVSQTEATVELVDLDLILREVWLESPIDGVAAIFFSETEITNAAYAQYLSQTGQMRDDTEIVALEEKRRLTGVVSTGGPFVRVSNPSSLWRRGQYPDGREEHPVSFITVSQAIAFCNWVDARYELDGELRLPTKNEWLWAAYGQHRNYPWGDDKRDWMGKGTEPVKARSHLRTPDGLYGMWGNVSELVLSPSDGYGGTVRDILQPYITVRLGPSYVSEEIRGAHEQPRQDYWGYNHSTQSRNDTWGFRIVFVPNSKDADVER